MAAPARGLALLAAVVGALVHVTSCSDDLEFVFGELRDLSDHQAAETAAEHEHAHPHAHPHADGKVTPTHAEHEHHGEHGHHKASPALLATSYLLIGFLISNFVLLRLVNYGDANVRSYTWKMMSSTVSIYLAVVLDGTMSAVIMYLTRTAMGVDKPRGVDWTKVITSSTMCLVWFLGVNFAVYQLRSEANTQWRFAASEIGGHITAFAGINALTACLDWLTDKMMSVVALSVFVGLVVVRLGLDRLRDLAEAPNNQEMAMQLAQCPEQEVYEGAEEEEEGEKRYSPDDWKEAACEAEDEATCIVSSFVASELLLKIIFNGPAEDEATKMTKIDMAWLSGIVLLCFGGVVATTYAIKLHDVMMTGKRPVIPMLQRWVGSFRSTIAMSTSWLLLRLCTATANRLFVGFSMHFIEVVNAFILTALAIVAIIFLDQLADKIDEDAPKEAKAQPMYVEPPPPPPPPTFYESLTACTSCPPTREPEMMMQDMRGMRMQQTHQTHQMHQMHQMHHRPSVTDVAATSLMETKNLEKAIRSIIGSFALAVGLGWENSFHAATHTVVDTIPVQLFQDYKVITKTGIAVFSFLLMLPVWLRHIVPKAELPVTAFQTLMEAEANVRPAATARPKMPMQMPQNRMLPWPVRR